MKYPIFWSEFAQLPQQHPPTPFKPNTPLLFCFFRLSRLTAMKISKLCIICYLWGESISEKRLHFITKYLHTESHRNRTFADAVHYRVFPEEKKCEVIVRPLGGHYWEYYSGTLPLSEVIATHLQIRQRTLYLCVADLQMSCMTEYHYISPGVSDIYNFSMPHRIY